MLLNKCAIVFKSGVSFSWARFFKMLRGGEFKPKIITRFVYPSLIRCITYFQHCFCSGKNYLFPNSNQVSIVNTQCTFVGDKSFRVLMPSNGGFFWCQKAYALLNNTHTCTIIVIWHNRVDTVLQNNKKCNFLILL